MSAIYNCALIRYEGGHAYLDRAAGLTRREVYLELGGIRDRDLALALGLRYLRHYAGPRYSDAIEGTVLDGDQVPTVGYNLGDNLDGRTLHAYTASLTGEGLTSIVPELDAPFDVAQATLARQIKRAGAGLTSEYARPNVNRQATGSDTDTTPPDFSLDGTLAPTFSPKWTAKRPWWGAWLDIEVLIPPTTMPLRVSVFRLTSPMDGYVVATATIGIGQTRGLVRLNRGWKVGESLILTIPDPSDAQKLTASLRGTMV